MNSAPPATRSEHGPPSVPHLVRPRPEHASDIRNLISACKPLDVNSTYAYLLLCQHFSDTCVIAVTGGHVVGFVSAYLTPSQPDTLFVWQVAVHERVRGQGLAGRMLLHLVARPAARTVRYVETTVSPSNPASARVFTRLAQALDAHCDRATLFPREAFGAEVHDEEVLFRIGPFRAGAYRAPRARIS